MSEKEARASVAPLRLADEVRGIRHVFVRDLMLLCRIGVHDHERVGGQRVRINVDLEVVDRRDHGDCLNNVVCYERISERIREIVAAGHVNLAETLAERIAAMALEDGRVLAAHVRVEKLDALADAGSVGVEIERRRGR
ncbi:MAG: dihydroneopterin aldolase [Rhodothalassiaceae bacterium]